jgi:redox-sensitive bicupin YhaK (pirin superfamily)
MTFETYPPLATALGRLPIARALPRRARRMIGPWCFLDRYGPLSFTDEKPMDVAPHPHIGLQTVSWLLEGEVIHHDSLECEATVRPGGVNVMTSGRGIAHSEETPPRNAGRLSGVQLWIALPDAHRHIDPAFHPIASVPRIELPGGVVQVIAGEFDDARSPAPSYSDILGLDVTLHGAFEMPVAAAREHGVMLLEGDARFEGTTLERDAMNYLGTDRTALAFTTSSGGRLLILGGAPFREAVVMWWNFVARSRDEIVEARAAWEAGEFGEVIGYDGPRIDAPPLARIAAPANPAS